MKSQHVCTRIWPNPGPRHLGLRDDLRAAPILRRGEPAFVLGSRGGQVTSSPPRATTSEHPLIYFEVQPISRGILKIKVFRPSLETGFEPFGATH